MVVTSDKTERAEELIEMAESNRKNPDKKIWEGWGYKIKEMSINVQEIRNTEKRANLIHEFLSERPGIKDLVHLAQRFAFPRFEHTFDEIVIIDTFIKFQKFHNYSEYTVFCLVKWSGEPFYEVQSANFDLTERHKLIRFLRENLP